jgi:hypothetical protein
MTDVSQASGAPALDALNIAAGVTAAAVTLAALAAVALAHTPVTAVLAVCGPLLTACTTVLKTR